MVAEFERLPTELRHYIWKLCLGEDGDAPTMVPWRTTRPFMLEEEMDDSEIDEHWDDNLLDEDDVDEDLTPEQQEEIRQIVEAHQSGAPVVGATDGTTAPPTSNGVANGATAEGEGDGEDAGDGDDDEDGDDEDGDDDDDDDDNNNNNSNEDEEEYDTDAGEFEPGNPYIHERAWDDSVVIPVYMPPLLLVNREARAVTLEWLKKHDIQLLRNNITKAEIETGFAPGKDGLPACVRKYDPARDFLYVDRHYWRRFCDRLYMPTLMAVMGGMNGDDGDGEDPEDEEPIHDIGPGIKNLALPAFTTYHSINTVANILSRLPAIESLAAIWGDLPVKEWSPQLVLETVQRDGKPKTQVTNVLLPRWDHVRISEKLSPAEEDRRREETERIMAEARKRTAKKLREKRGEPEPEGEEDDTAAAAGQEEEKDGAKEDSKVKEVKNQVEDEEEDEEDDDEDEDEDDEEDEEDEEEEGQGPIVSMCMRDPEDDERVYYERGYLTDYMTDIYNELAFSEGLPDHVVDEYDGSITLDIHPCSAVLQS